MATTLTIDNLDDATFHRLESEARRLGRTPAEAAADLLRGALAPAAAGPGTPLTAEERRRRLAALAGTWTDEDLREFEEVTAPFREIDPEIWR